MNIFFLILGLICLGFIVSVLLHLRKVIKDYEFLICFLFTLNENQRNSQLKRLRKQYIDIIANAKAHAIVDVLNFQKEYYFEDPRIKKLLIREKLYD